MRLKWRSPLICICICMLTAGLTSAGSEPLPEAVHTRIKAAPGETVTVTQTRRSGVLTELSIATESADTLWLMAWWDAERSPAIDIPIRLLPHSDGRYRLPVPAPFQRGMRLALRNPGASAVAADAEWQVEARRSVSPGRLRALPYREPYWRVPAHDDILADLKGRGVLRMVLLDGNPGAFVQAASDGASVGTLAASGMPMEIPFYSSLRLYVPQPDEPGEERIGGTALYMDEPGLRTVVTDRFQPGDLDDERRHGYTLKERRLLAVLTYREPLSRSRIDRPGRAHRGSSRFMVRVDPANRGVLLQLRAAPSQAERVAHVTVNGLPVSGGWRIPAAKQRDGWVDTVLHLPEPLTRRHRQLQIEISVAPDSPEPDWSEHGYQVVCLFEQSRSARGAVALPEVSEQIRRLQRSQPWGPAPSDLFQCRMMDDGSVALLLYRAPGAIWRRANEVTLAGVTAGSISWSTQGGEAAIPHVSQPSASGWMRDGSSTRLYLNDDQLARLSDGPLLFRLKDAHWEPSLVETTLPFDPSAVRWAGSPLHLGVPAGTNAGRFTVEAWVKMRPHHTFQAIIAHGPKDARHWELFVYPGTNTLRLYAPGLQPVEVDAGVVIADERWHFISARVSSEALLIEVDGQVALERPVQGAIAPSDLPVTVGALMEEVIPLQGVLGELRLSSGWRPLGTLPSGPLTRDADTLLLVAAEDRLLR